MLSTPPQAPLLKLLKTPTATPLEYFQEIARYGDIVRIPLSKRYFINDPDGIQRILQINFNNYTKAGSSYRRLQEALGPGLLTDSGEAWEKRRQDLQALFYLKNLNKFTDTINHYTQSTLDQWESTYAQSRQYFNLTTELLALVANISAATLFGLDISAEAKKIIKLVLIGNDYIAKTVSISPWLPSFGNLRFRITTRKLNHMLLDAFKTQRNLAITEPLLAKVITEYENHEIDTKEFLGDVKNFFVAGHETTGNALSWAIYCLMQHPEILAHLQQEFTPNLTNKLLTLDDINKLSYTEMFISEVLRLYPPIWITERKALNDDEIGGYLIPANSAVIISQYTIHRHPKYWHNPEAFNPERFTAENSKNRHKCAYIPFGTGPRMCIGKQLAMMTMKIILPSILQRFEIKLAQTRAVEVEALVTLKPKGGMWVTIKSR